MMGRQSTYNALTEEFGFSTTEASVMLTQASHDGESEPRNGWKVFYLGGGEYAVAAA
jgi:hypothetical protein